MYRKGNRYMNENNDVFWDMITDQLLEMTDEQFNVAIKELKECVSIAICNKLDSMEDEIQSTKSGVSDIINRF
jgi:hypothetical protein